LETNLHFVITLTEDRGDVCENITVPSEHIHEFIRKKMIQYAQLGCFIETDSSITFTPTSQLKQVTVEKPSIVIANGSDVDRTAKAADNVKKIIL